MNRIRTWIALALAAALPALVALQPVITYACGGSGSHGGC